MGRIITRDDGRAFHIGGRCAPAKPHHLRLHDPKYGLNLGSWPATPSSTSYGQAPAAQACLIDILGNGDYGNCTEADQFHRQALRQAAGGLAVYHPPVDVVLSIYSRDGGFVMGQPQTDQGCDETIVMQNAVTSGIPKDASGGIDKPAGFILIDPTNRSLVRAAVSAFVGASICMSLPDAWISPFPSSPGWTWGVPIGGFVPNPSNGHCFTLGDQNDSNLQCWSWGMPFILTYDALAAGAVDANGGAIYIVVDQEILAAASQKAPDALDWAALIADFNDAGGSVPVPSPSPPSPPTPPTPPTPAPGTPVTLPMAQAWAQAGIRAGAALQDQDQACANSDAGLAKSWPAAS